MAGGGVGGGKPGKLNGIKNGKNRLVFGKGWKKERKKGSP